MSSQDPADAPQASWNWKPLLGAIVLLLLAWALREAAMLFFGAVLAAATFRALANPLAKTGRISPTWALALVLVALAALLVAMGWWIGEPVSAQLQTLSVDVPKAWAALRHWLSERAIGAKLLELSSGLPDTPVPWARIAGVAGGTLRALSAVILVLLMGIYLAFDPDLYLRGVVRLFPVQRRADIQGALEESGQALMRWLTGQVVTMIAVGVLVTVGLSLLRMPLALALGLISGLLEFVPFFGPIASGLLAVLVAFAQGPQAALYVALLFLAIGQVEGNLLVPLVQRWAVKLPPVLGVAAVIVFGALFGVAGVIFGTPLMVVTMVLVRRLYIERTLEGKAA